MNVEGIVKCEVSLESKYALNLLLFSFSMDKRYNRPAPLELQTQFALIFCSLLSDKFIAHWSANDSFASSDPSSNSFDPV